MCLFVYSMRLSRALCLFLFLASTVYILPRNVCMFVNASDREKARQNKKKLYMTKKIGIATTSNEYIEKGGKEIVRETNKRKKNGIFVAFFH